MYAVLEVPAFRLRAVERLRSSPVDSGAALVVAEGRRSRVVACDPVAGRSGVRAGMTAAAALARQAGLTLFEADPGAEEAAGRLLWAEAARLSPGVERSARGWLTVDLRGRPVERLGSEVRRAVESLESAGLPARAGLARTPFLARIAALRAGPLQWIHDGDGLDESERSESGFLRTTPIADAFADWEDGGEADRFVGILQDWGVETLADFAALDRAAVAARLGMGGADLHDQVRGRKERLLRIDPPEQVFAVKLETESPIERMEPLLFIIRRLLETLSSELAAAVLAAATVRIELHPEGGGEPWVATLDLPEPTHRVDPIFAILQSRLEGLRMANAIAGVCLRLEPHEKIRRQGDLFAARLEDPHRLADTLARLRGLYGPEGYGSPRRADQHDPDGFVLEAPAEWNGRPPGWPTGLESGDFDTAPVEIWRQLARSARVVPDRIDRGPVLRRFRPPRPVRVLLGDTGIPERILEGRPAGKILDLRGPWIQSGAWWDRDAWTRIEWDVDLGPGAGLYRLVEIGEGQWVLDGMYD